VIATIWTALVIAIGSYGLWYTVGRGKISQYARDALQPHIPWVISMIECPGCFGFWTGLLVMIIALSDGIAFKIPIHTEAYPYIPILPFFTVATNRLLHGLASIGDRNDHDLAQ
jgi:hypothetical protein